MVNTAAKGARFERRVSRVLSDSGFIVSRNAASKPWDLNAANEMVVYAVECKSSHMSPISAKNTYVKLAKILRVRVVDGDGVERLAQSAFVPIVFFIDKLGRLSMFTQAKIHDAEGRTFRPYFDGEHLTEVVAIG